MKHIAIVYPPHTWSTLDVAVGYSRAFQSLGFHVIDVHYERLFQKWHQWLGIKNEEVHEKKENKIYERATADVIAEILKHQPDIALVVDGTQIHAMFWDWMDRLNIPTVAVMTDCPYYDEKNAYVAERSTFPFANDSFSAEKMGVPYLPMAYSPEIHRPFLVSQEYKSDVVFVGSGFPERVALLEQVDWSGIDLRLFGYWDLGAESPLAPFFRQESLTLPNPETAMYYNGAKIVLDLHRTSIDFDGTRQIDGRGSVGPRIYEAAACGACIAAQSGIEEMDKLLGDAYLPFMTPDELLHTLRIWLQDSMFEARLEMGHQARMRVKKHSYASRALDILRFLEA